LKKSQKGFALLETFLVVVIVGLLAFVCWYVFTSASDTNNTYDNTAVTQTNLPSNSKNDTSKVQTKQVVITKTDAKLGDYLADTDGKALYTQGQDPVTHISSCTGTCLDIWPIYNASSATKLPANVSTLQRKDNGKLQYTYKAYPLYYYAGDTSAGMVTGDNVSNFRLARP
jgi:predicted lipoprotein with Yx(FWY)xxD motif